ERDLVREPASGPEPGRDPVLRPAEAALHLADLELRALGRDDEVAGLRERIPEAERIAVYGRDHGLPVHGLGEPVLSRAATGGPPESLQLLPSAELTLLDVGARAERAAGAGGDRDRQLSIRVELEQRVVDVLDQPVVGRVELLGPVERDVTDGALRLVEYRFELRRMCAGHRVLLSPWPG